MPTAEVTSRPRRSPAKRKPSSTVVRTLAEQEIELQDEREVHYYRSAQDRYLSDNAFTVASDLRALDRLIFFETLVYRWQAELASGFNWDGDLLMPGELETARKNIKESAPLIAQIQNDLGLTKMMREKDQAESLNAYISRLKIAAKEHGVRREKQLGKAIELTKELFSLCGAYTRSSPQEREKLGFETADDIIAWVLDVMKPDFDQVDEHFREHQQKFWVRQI